MSAALLTHRSLLLRLIRRDIASKYRGAALGVVWSLINPILMLMVYTFVFSVVFKMRWPIAEGQPHGQVALILFAGLIVHGLGAEALLRAPTTITSQVNFVKKLMFPLEILPLVPLGSALFHFVLNLLVLLLAELAIMGSVPYTAVWFPLVMLPFLIGLLGAVWLFCSLGVFLRDIGQVMGLVVAVLMFLSPIFFPVEALPEQYRPLLELNPLTIIITQMRDVLLWGKFPDLWALAKYAVASSAFAAFGYLWFMRTRKGFADVL